MNQIEIVTLVFTCSVITYSLSSVYYVYKLRGNLRYQSMNEYIRKGWFIFAPLNCLFYLLTRPYARQPIMDIQQFPELDEIRESWQVIRQEALALREKQHFDQVEGPASDEDYYDLGFRTFYKYGWSKFYLNWYGYQHASALDLCPKTSAILAKNKHIQGAMFSFLPPGGRLTRHLDPIAYSLRYQIGLDTPNSQQCFIDIDGQQYAWKDGESLIFDETYIHYVENNSDQQRLILMCDIRRPMNPLGRSISFIMDKIMPVTVVPNMPGDRRGLLSRVFATVSPFLSEVRKLKQSNKALYRLIKHTTNFVLLALLLSLFVGIFYALMWLTAM